MRRSLAGLSLLLAALAGCGGGGDAAAGAAPTKAIAGLEEDAGEAGAAAKKAAASPTQASKIDPSLIPEPGTPLVRETYSWEGGSRDPFASVLDNAGIGPELSELDLMGIYYVEREPSASVVVLRDRITGKRFSVREGERIGRARVADIRLKEVTFTIDDYGTQRQVTLSLRKREDITP